MQFRQVLRALGKKSEGKIMLRKILFKNRHRMTSKEFAIIEYAYLEKLSSCNIAEKLVLSESHYYNVLNQALTKFETLISDAEMREIVKAL